ncbi:DoxX family protein [Flavobacterium sp. ENC]|uniref:DoxX family protein n=1 Tax=Flavobacterium sp. ENC TaxID=2897330 RepID=UPI001E399BA3|nr:DoxX family protein [Flavobacterium sp. ENC]MCD0467066.1 DoxX family protein [Flavobacterium sp. ENC]
MKKAKIIFWITTIIIFLFEGVMPALTSQSELAKEGIRHLGYPEYFGNALVVFKVLGVLALVIPQVPNRIKEWAYAGFTFDFLFASISHFAVDGFGFQSFFPLIILVILLISYFYYHKIERHKNIAL